MRGEKTMPFSQINDIDIHYKLEGDGNQTIVLINGLADDLEWTPRYDPRTRINTMRFSR